MEAVAGKGEAEAVVTVVMVAWVAAAECTMERVGASVCRQISYASPLRRSREGAPTCIHRESAERETADPKSP